MTLNKDSSIFLPYFVIDYGKHKSTLNFSKDAENPDLIMISSIRENDRYVFLGFTTEKASPEPYEDEIYRVGRWNKFTNQSITGIFDKKTKAFHFLLQPIRGIPGIKNDIDGGISFFVRNVSSNNRLIDYYHAHKFLELAERLPSKSDSFAKVVSEISEEDNPVVLIAE